jgi:transcriptional regulator with XRE-family HTH domain
MGNTKSPRFTELRAWMKKTKTNQQALARLLNLSESQVSLWLRGFRNLSAEAGIKLSLLTDIPVEKLLTGGDAARLLKLLGKQRTSATPIPEDKSSVA